MYLRATVLAGCMLASVLGAATATSVGSGIAVSLSVNGRYAVRVPGSNWVFAGSIGSRPGNIREQAGSDHAGPYQEIVFRYDDGVPREASIRAYADVPAVVFAARQLAAGLNTAAFPNFATWPRGVFNLSYAGLFAAYGFDEWNGDSPWVFFDRNGRTFILSAAANFMSARLGRGEAGEIQSRIAASITDLPEGFEQRTVLVVESGVNRAFETWGKFLTTLHGKPRPASGADASLARIGYWTDNGASYYYRYEEALGYSGTLLALRDEFARKGVQLGSLQLDSWFYPKGANADWTDLAGGIYTYTADPTLFPERLSGFQQRLGAPLMVHSRWIDARSPYRKQYRISGNVATDPLYWDRVASYMVESGAAIYEQDWLGTEARADANLADPEEFLTNMATALAARGVDIQYCMALPRHFLQSVRYPNVTTIRASTDRFSRDKWGSFLYASRLASALGLWPFTDVFLSTETDNLLVATLSAGPLGVGDRLGAVEGANLLRAVRPDGTVVKPDAPLVPVDEVYLREARGGTGPMVAATRTDFGEYAAAYVFAFARDAERGVAFRPSALGVAGRAYVYDYFQRRGRLVEAGETFSDTMEADRAYYIAVPVGPSRVALVGDAGHFVPLGRQRIPRVSGGEPLGLTVAFVPGEGPRTLFGWAAAAPVVTARQGSAGPVRFDVGTGLFQVDVAPGPEGTAELEVAAARDST